MPEIWLNYGATNVVLDIRAENLDQQLDSKGNFLNDLEIGEKLDGLDISKPIELVVLNNSNSVKRTIKAIFEKFEQKSVQKPRILTDKKMVNLIKKYLPEGSSVAEFSDQISNSSLVFVGEMEFDGLFGFETIATRLIKKFGKESMLSAYEKRKENLPVPGKISKLLKILQTGLKLQQLRLRPILKELLICQLAIQHPLCLFQNLFLHQLKIPLKNTVL